jgi:hypothetical protein
MSPDDWPGGSLADGTTAIRHRRLMPAGLSPPGGVLACLSSALRSHRVRRLAVTAGAVKPGHKRHSAPAAQHRTELTGA